MDFADFCRLHGSADMFNTIAYGKAVVRYIMPLNIPPLFPIDPSMPTQMITSLLPGSGASRRGFLPGKNDIPEFVEHSFFEF